MKSFVVSIVASTICITARAESIREDQFSMRFRWCAIHHVRLQTTAVYQSDRWPPDLARPFQSLWDRYHVLSRLTIHAPSQPIIHTLFEFGSVPFVSAFSSEM
jgi:hypothetical protein